MISFKGEFSIARDKHRWDFSSATLKCITGVPPLKPGFGISMFLQCIRWYFFEPNFESQNSDLFNLLWGMTSQLEALAPRGQLSKGSS